MDSKIFFRYLRKKAQGLPLSTIVLIILVVIVLAAVGIFFFRSMISGQSATQVGLNVSNRAVSNLSQKASEFFG